MTIAAGGQVEAGDFAFLGAWTTWSPTYSNITVGNGTVTAKYQQVGKIVHCRFRLVWGSTTSFSGTPEVYLPVAANGYAINDAMGHGFAWDASVGSASREGVHVVYDASDRVFFVRATATTGTIGATVPFTWTTSDIITFQSTYEAS